MFSEEPQLETRGGKPGGVPDTLPRSHQGGPITWRHVERIVCLPTRATGRAVRRGRHYHASVYERIRCGPGGRLGFLWSYCMQ